MTCMMLSRSCAQESDLNAPCAKLNHRRFRALLKKLRRKKIRQKAAQERDRLLQVEEKVPLLPCQEEQEQEEQERQRQHELWLEREAEAQRQFKQRCRLEEERRTALANWAEKASKEESLQQVLAQLPVASPSRTPREESWHNPPAPSTYAPTEACPFYLKTGACRFGDWCSRAHPRPAVSRTLLLRGLYSHLSLEQHHGDDSLETDERELQAHFEAFFWDVLEELRRAGTVCQLRVCRNLEPHLRGNVYVQYSRSPPPQRQRSRSPVVKRRRRSRSPHRLYKRSRASRSRSKSRSKSKNRKKRHRHKSRSRSRSRSKKSPTHSSRSKHR